ncbi:class I SAM-dependent methyltransferase [Capillimicrobium parvum]|uniref:tRNA 5-carboxymethoxyuridine methyltransferase n=1 Tax=Capillimicrobium parvum TaxID=2884022 RepID=A0A9E7BWC8_9ACTN|nr:class I SAM-dependent methyltransferase [Capillimicrobium parvum]UGS33765.1 tRNA 5-carboxymethoxyuridine methyltransferase [Capillimicrobium parvum]
MTLTAAALDDYAREYYLAGDVADLGIEELQQTLSLDAVAAAAGGCDRVLEMGYGTGLTTRELLARGLGLEVLEGSPELARRARAAHPALPVHEGLFEQFVPERPFDAVLALHVLEHVDGPRALLRHAAGWLRPGGRLVVAVPNAESLHRRLAVRMGLQEHLDSLSARDGLVGHRRVYSLARLGDDVRAAGLRVVDEFGWFLKVLPNSMMLGFDEPLLRALFGISEELEPSMLANIAIVAQR